MVTVRDLMTRVVFTLSFGDSLATADQRMKELHIRHLPVVDGEGTLVGLVTHRMVLAAWVGRFHPMAEQAGEVASQVPVEMIMQREVLTVGPDSLAGAAAELMEMNKFGCLPVVQEGRLMGILTESDFVRYARRVLLLDGG